jgi:hypothetical protein
MSLAVARHSSDESNKKTPANTAVVTAFSKNSPKVSRFAKLSTYSATSAPISSAM